MHAKHAPVHGSLLERSGNEVALRTIPYLFYFSKSSLSHSTSLSVFEDSVISCILLSTKCKSGLTGQEFCGKTHGVGVDREKQARKPKPEANQKDTEMKLGVQDRNSVEKPTAWARRAHMCKAHI